MDFFPDRGVLVCGTVDKVGFTLIEVLIAASIFSIIVLGLYSAFRTGIAAYNKMDSAFAVYQSARVVLSRISLELRNSFSYSGNDSGFNGLAQNLEFTSVIDLFKKDKFLSYICRVKYELENGVLKRTCRRGIDALSENPELEGEELSADVKEILFQYAYATANPDAPYDWQDSWPQEGNSDQKKNLPLAVRIKLSLIERDRRQHETGVVEFVKVVPLAD